MAKRKPFLVKYTTNDNWEHTWGVLVVVEENKANVESKAIEIIKENGYWDENYEIEEIKEIKKDSFFIQAPFVE